jgi:hypothetical protein
MHARPFRDANGNWKTDLHVWPFYGFFILFSLFTCRLPFFWDKDIYFSRLAHWLIAHHYSILLPGTLDPGYPPALGYLLASAWQLAGMHLQVMHLLMLPFTLGIIWQTSRLLRYYLPEEAVVPGLIIILANPVFLAQTVVYSTDLVMLFFMLMAIHAVLYKKKAWLAVAVTGLLFSHMRGLTVGAAIGIFDLYVNASWKKLRRQLRTLLPYVPGLTLFIAWLIFHQETSGWTGYHADSPWAGCFEIVSVKGFLRNCAVVSWRLLDFGNIALFLVSGLLITKALKRPTENRARLYPLLLLLGICLAFTLPVMLVYKNLNGHRYLIPVYYAVSLLTVYLLFSGSFPATRRKWITLAIVAVLVSGNFWVYPDTIAKGWDSSLAHLPYHSLRQKMIRFMDQHSIPVSETGSRIPNTALFDHISLNGDLRAFHPADLNRDKYVFYSNICNDFSDDEITALKTRWKIVKEYRCLQVRVTLYEKIY